ncbi:MAG: transcription elongation factor GreA [Deltaproteobacteria bacterium]|nr:transcription elongation factor GreA [Deltaproteobacteria bacterium]
MQRLPMTREGFEKIRREIETIKTVDRPRIIHEIEVARAHGDLSENAEYHAAKEKSGHISGRLLYLEDRLSRAEIIDPLKMKGVNKVMFGAHVTIVDLESDKKITYQVLGEDESDISNGRISISSPVGKALIGKATEDVIKVSTPKGPKEFEIVAIEYR